MAKKNVPNGNKKEVETRPQVDLASVPTSLDGLLSFGGEGKNVHEVLGVLVEAHQREAEAILGRTNVSRREAAIVTNLFHLARHGIGGPMSKPMPFLSRWGLDLLRILPSVGGASRREFVEAWQNSQQERLRKAQEEERQKQRLVGA